MCYMMKINVDELFKKILKVGYIFCNVGIIINIFGAVLLIFFVLTGIFEYGYILPRLFDFLKSIIFLIILKKIYKYFEEKI